MTLEPILLVGAGGHAVACIDVIEQEGRFKVVGLVGQLHEVGTGVLGYPVLGSDGDLSRLLMATPMALITVGHIETPEPRMRLFKQVQRLGGRLPTIISPRAYVSRHARLGEGTIVMHGAVVNAGALVGCNTIINSLALVEHGVEVGDHCHVATAAVINGGVTVGRGTFVGSGSRLRQSLTIGAHCLIGMGQVVLADCPDGSRLPQEKKHP